MLLNKVEAGIRVKIHALLGKTDGLLINQRYLDARKPNAVGVVRGWVPGHGGDVWWVEHEDGTVAAYMFDEFAKVK